MSVKYHVTPISGPRIDTGRFLAQRNALVPFLRQDDLQVALMVCTSVIFDSSAYTLWKQGTMDYEEHYPRYIEWVRAFYRHPRFAWCIIPDVIGGTEEQNDEYLTRWPEDLKHIGIPVWHMKESLTRLLRLCQNYPRVAFAQADFKGSIFKRLDEAMAEICDPNGQPICKLHGLKMQDPNLFTKYPFSSTDSSNVAQNNALILAKGKQPTVSQCSDYIANRIEHYNSAAAWDIKPIQQNFLGLLNFNQ